VEHECTPVGLQMVEVDTSNVDTIRKWSISLNYVL